MSERELFNVLYYIMANNIKTMRIDYSTDKVGFMVSYDYDAFVRGTGFILYDYGKIMAIAITLNNKQKLEAKLDKVATRYSHLLKIDDVF